MKHIDCKNYTYLDCEKGMCALTKAFLPIDGKGSEACPRFVMAPKCGFCKHLSGCDEHGIGTCTGFEKPNWAYATCGAAGCEHFEMKQV